MIKGWKNNPLWVQHYRNVNIEREKRCLEMDKLESDLFIQKAKQNISRKPITEDSK